MSRLYIIAVVMLGLIACGWYLHHRWYHQGYDARLAEERAAQVEQDARDKQAVDKIEQQNKHAEVIYRDKIKIVEKLVPSGECVLPPAVVEQLRDASTGEP